MKKHNRQRRQLLQASGVVLLLGPAQLAWVPVFWRCGCGLRWNTHE
jgi:hypothetical protein